MVGNFFSKNNRRGKSAYRNRQVFRGPSVEKPAPVFAVSFTHVKYAVLVLMVIGIVYFFFYSKAFAISDVIIEGARLVDKQRLIEAAPRGSNIFRFKLVEAESDYLAQFPELKSVQIFRGIPNALKIVVFERDGKIRWQTGEDKYLISSQGEVSRKAMTDEDNLLPLVIDRQNIAVKPGDQLVSPTFVAFVNNVYGSFFETVNIKPVTLEVKETTFDINLVTEAGFYVKLNTLRSSKKQLENLKTVLSTKRADIHEYVDLRIDGWAYYK